MPPCSTCPSRSSYGLIAASSRPCPFPDHLGCRPFQHHPLALLRRARRIGSMFTAMNPDTCADDSTRRLGWVCSDVLACPVTSYFDFWTAFKNRREPTVLENSNRPSQVLSALWRAWCACASGFQFFTTTMAGPVRTHPCADCSGARRSKSGCTNRRRHPPPGCRRRRGDRHTA